MSRLLRVSSSWIEWATLGDFIVPCAAVIRNGHERGCLLLLSVRPYKKQPAFGRRERGRRLFTLAALRAFRLSVGRTFLSHSPLSSLSSAEIRRRRRRARDATTHGRTEEEEGKKLPEKKDGGNNNSFIRSYSSSSGSNSNSNNRLQVKHKM